MAAAIPPHWVWPRTTRSGQPHRARAYSIVPISSLPATLDATRMTNSRPTDSSNTISGGTRLSEQPRITAKGSAVASDAAAASGSGACSIALRNRPLPARSNWSDASETRAVPSEFDPLNPLPSSSCSPQDARRKRSYRAAVRVPQIRPFHLVGVGATRDGRDRQRQVADARLEYALRAQKWNALAFERETLLESRARYGVGVQFDLP